MRILVVILTFFLIVFSSCLFEKKHKDVDSFYTAKVKYDFPRIPLVKPFFMIYDENEKEWLYDYPTSLEYGMSPSNTDTIGIDKNYLYGYIKGGNTRLIDYEKGMLVYLREDGVTVFSEDLIKSKKYIRLELLDLSKKIFHKPNRWFVVNAKDSTRHVFLSNLKYKEFLNKNNISGKTYNTKKMDKQFLDTGILPWFPDSIKTKLLN